MKTWAWLLGAAVVAVALLMLAADPTPLDPGEVADPAPDAAPDLLEAEARPPRPAPEIPSHESAAGESAAGAPAPPAVPTVPPMIPPQVLETSFEYRDGSRKTRVWRNPRVLLEFRQPQGGAGTPASPATPTPPVEGAELVRTDRFTRVWKLPEGSDAQEVADNLQVTETGDYSPAFHAAPSSASSMRGLPGGVIVQFPKDWDAERVDAWAKDHELGALAKMTIVPNWFTFETAPGLASLEVANRLYATGEVLVATPNWWREQRKR